ncbi:MAG: MaoC family dehydratase N-terminal domain-containing protein, partial [Acidimicrobiales bacterium]
VTESRPLDDADLAALHDVVGAELAVAVRPYVEYATVDSMRNFARSYGDNNPLFGDEDYGSASPWGTIVAPPLFPIATGLPVVAAVEPAAVVRHALRGVAVEVVDDRWTLHRLIPPGTRLARADSIASVDVAEMATGATATVTTRSTYTVGDTHYGTHDRVRVHGGRSIAEAIGSDDHRDEREGKARYDEDALAEIDRSIAAWRRRGAVPLATTELAVGATIGPIVKGPLTVTDLVAYRAGVGPGPFGVEPLDLARRNRRERPDFYDRDDTGGWDARERLHWDEAYAQRCGHPSAYDYTHTRCNWMVHLLTDWMGDHARLETISFAHLAHNYVGDTHWIDGTILAVDVEQDRTRATIELRGVNQLGAVTCRGAATVSL